MSLAVVSGAPGWLGTSLAETLVRGAQFKSISTAPRKVRCIVQPQIDTTPLAPLGDSAEIVTADIRNRASLFDACKDADTVFHCAGIIHPRRIQDLYDINVTGTQNLLESAIAAGAKRFIYVSSNSPAGLNASPSTLMKEKDPPRPYLNYGLSKLQSEWLINEAHRSGKIEAVILRPCWFYGPNQPERQSRFFKMIKGGHPIVVGKGDNLRSMSYVDNVVQAMLLAEQVEKAAGKTYWIADRRPYSFIEIVQTVAGVLGVQLRPRYLPTVTSDVARFVDSLIQMSGWYNQEVHVAGELAATIAVSIEAAQRDLGYAPEVELEEGMRLSIEWCRAHGHGI